MKKTKLMLGDNIESLKKLPDNSIDSVVTDPPYGLKFMNSRWDYDVPSVDFWREVYRVLKPGGHVLSFGGTRTYHRMVVNIEDAGFEIRDQIMWLYGSGFPKSHNIGKAVEGQLVNGNSRYSGNKMETDVEINKKSGLYGELGDRTMAGGLGAWSGKTIKVNNENAKKWNGWGTALKPAQEIIAVAQKPENLDGTALNLIYNIKKEIWKLYVKIVEQSSELNQVEQKEVLDIAQCLVEKNTNIQVALQGLMDMSQLKLMESMNWNIVLLWHNILEDLLQKMSRYTTSTKSNLIIDLKTLKSLEWQNILENITQVKNNQIDGLNVNALTAVVLFNAINMKLKTTQTHSVEDNVIYKEEEMDCQNEPICLARKPLSEKSVAENVLKWGVGGINVDGTRIKNSLISSTPVDKTSDNIYNTIPSHILSELRNTLYNSEPFSLVDKNHKDFQSNDALCVQNWLKLQDYLDDYSICRHLYDGLLPLFQGGDQVSAQQLHDALSYISRCEGQIYNPCYPNNHLYISSLSKIILMFIDRVVEKVDNLEELNEGRFPANLILECCCDKGDIHTNPDCPCYIMDSQSGETKVGKGIRSGGFQKGYINGDVVNRVINNGYNDKGGASRYFQQIKGGGTEDFFIYKENNIILWNIKSLTTQEYNTEENIEASDALKQARESICQKPELYGNNTTVQYLMTTIYITKMKTHSIMNLTILNAYTKTTIGNFTLMIDEKQSHLLTEESILNVQIVSNQNALVSSIKTNQEVLVPIVSYVLEENLKSGETIIENTITNTTENIKRDRFFYNAKVSKAERNMGLDDFEEKETDGSIGLHSVGGAPTKDNKRVMKNHHPTIKPINLMTYLCRLITPPNGICLDPFMGSGSTGIAAQLEGFRFIGMEMDEEYFKIAEARINSYEKYKKFVK